MATHARLDPVERSSGIAGPGRWPLGAVSSAIPVTAVIGAVLVVAAVLRFWSLTAWPVFSDEDSYTATAIAVADLPVVEQIRIATPRTFKAPMLVLVHANLAHLGVDPLFAGRVMSAVAGLVTTVLTWELGRRLGGRTVGVVAATLYAVSPMAVLH
jgi:4-amino-4-deoxy-L-arabinose transferase-like glycosyltransferase